MKDKLCVHAVWNEQCGICESVDLIDNDVNDRVQDAIDMALEDAEKREEFSKHSPACPMCGTRQVQLMDWINNKKINEADWKCRHCHCEWRQKIHVTPSQHAKILGLKNLTQVSQITGTSLNTLTNWHRDKPELFRIVLKGCISELTYNR